MSNLPKISIITPSFNQGEYIQKTIDSVLSQKYPNLEYIIIDGGSTDHTLDILRSYGDNLIWISEKDRGQSHAINKGLRMVTGEVIAFLNSDDLYEPGAFLRVGTFFADHPEAHWLTGRCRIIDPHGREIRRLITLYKNFWLLWKSYTILMVLDYVSQPATFWRREVIEMVGGFDEALRYAMDYDYSLRVGKHFKLWMMKHYLASFRIHPSSKAGASAHAQFDADFQILKQHTSSPLILALHRIHNSAIVRIYRTLMQAAIRPQT